MTPSESIALATAAILAWLASGVVALAGIGGGWLLRRQSASTRSWWFRTSMLGTALGVALAIGGALLPEPRPGTLPAQVAPLDLAAVSVAASLPLPTGGTATPAVPSRLDRDVEDTTRKVRIRDRVLFLRALLCCWVAGAALLALRWCAGMIWLRRLGARSRQLTAGPAAELLRELCGEMRVKGPILAAAEPVEGPFLAGITRPTIWVPAAFEREFDLSTMRGVLAHELAHLRRRDNAWLAGVTALGFLLWPQPLVWILSRHLQHACEEAADLEALRHGCSPDGYASMLVTVAERMVPRAFGRVVGVTALPYRSALGRRVEQVLGSSGRAQRLEPGRVAGTCLLFAAALGLCASIGWAAPELPRPAAPQGTAADARPADLLTLEEASTQVPFKLKVPPVPGNVSISGVRYTAEAITDKAKVRDFLLEREAVAMVYGIQLQFRHGLTLALAVANHVAAERGFPRKQVELISVNGYRPRVPDQDLVRKMAPDKQKEAYRLQGELLAKMRDEPLKLVYLSGGKQRTVTLPKRKRIVLGVFRADVIRPNSAALVLDVRRNPQPTGPLSATMLIQTPTTQPTTDPARPPFAPKNSARVGAYGKGTWVQGVADSPSAVYWSTGGMDFWLNNPSHLLRMQEIRMIIGGTGHSVPEAVELFPTEERRFTPIKPKRQPRGHRGLNRRRPA